MAAAGMNLHNFKCDLVIIVIVCIINACVLVPTAIVLSLVCEAVCSRLFISVIGLNIIVKGAILGA